MSARDPHGERDFLREVGPPDFADLVSARLDEAGAGLHGDPFTWMALDRFWDELDAEAIDLAAWAVLLARRYELDDLQGPHLDALRGALTAAALHARRAHDVIAEARRRALAPEAT